jgi:hypothetical protein
VLVIRCPGLLTTRQWTVFHSLVVEAFEVWDFPDEFEVYGLGMASFPSSHPPVCLVWHWIHWLWSKVIFCFIARTGKPKLVWIHILSHHICPSVQSNDLSWQHVPDLEGPIVCGTNVFPLMSFRVFPAGVV